MNNKNITTNDIDIKFDYSDDYRITVVQYFLILEKKKKDG